jgi:integrase/recombinase XerD
MSAIAPTLEAFFTERLIRQRDASPHTIAASDAWRLLLRFVHAQTGAEPCQLDLAALDAPSSAPSSTTWKPNGGTAHERATPASPRSAHSSVTRPCATPSTQRSSPGCSLSHKRHEQTEVSYLAKPEVEATVDQRTSPCSHHPPVLQFGFHC